VRKAKLLIAAALLAVPVVSMAQTVSAKDHKLVDLLNGVYLGSPKAISTFPAGEHKDGLLGFIKRHGLVITSSDGDCPTSKNGVCDAWIYLTRSSYPRHRSDDRGAFCGVMVRWEASDENLRNWRPANGLAESIMAGNVGLVLSAIDGKNASYCN
jgi:hypothetical protein